ncbi:MAG: HEAT repeat domain-containing protein [Methanomicrobiales archaeon]|jgi:HEAT repeat protein|nr:HEAT repeat domain-containing protein [Methanomicrobiales archaeon]
MGFFSRFRARKDTGEGSGNTRSPDDYVRDVLSALTYGDVDARWAAIRAVGELGEGFIEPLARALHDEHWVIRRGASNTLGGIGAHAVGPLIRSLTDEDEDVRVEVIRALLLIRDPAKAPLTEAIRDPDPLVRRGVIETLGRMKVAEAVHPSLTSVLADEDPWVRQEAAVALGRIGDPVAVEPLVALLKDSFGFVRMAAATSLTSIGDAAIPPLIRSLSNGNSDLQRTAALTLASFRALAVQPLIAALADANPSVRAGAAGVLGQVRDPTSVQPLVGLLGDPERAVRREAVNALSDMGGGAVQALIPVFQEGGPIPRNSAMEALWMIGTPAAPTLTSMLKDTRIDVRRRAALLLGEIADKASIEPLRGVLTDSDTGVRREAFEAIEMIKRREGFSGA